MPRLLDINQVPGFGMKSFCPIFSTLLSVRPLPRLACSTSVFELLKVNSRGSFFRASSLKAQCQPRG